MIMNYRIFETSRTLAKDKKFMEAKSKSKIKKKIGVVNV